MHHVRLRVESCEMLFIDHSTPDQTIRLPHLKSLIYTCARPPSTPLLTCRGPYPSTRTHRHRELLWYAVTSNLQTLVATPNAVPTDAQVYAFTTIDSNHNDLSLWKAHIRADVRVQTSLALPHRAVWTEARIRASHVLRLQGGREVMSVPANIEATAEGQMGREVPGGARLPAAMLTDARVGKASFAVGCEEKPLEYLKTSTQWREENPGKKIRIWINEENMGIRLVGTEVRKGKDECLSLEMVREITPEGWRRVVIHDVLEEIVT
ncbi:F-box domain containing protein [Pyrenophora tritici-repentis]|nr:F-box domain containing protein [Pyrenophora tritici-repentis]